MSAPLAAQRAPLGLARGFEAGLSAQSIFVPQFIGSRVSTLSLLVGGLNPGGTGFEATAAVGPLGGSDGGSRFLIMDLDATKGISVGSSLVMIRAGGGLIGGEGGTPTVNAGTALLIPIADRVALRLDGTVRFFLLALPHAYFVGVGLGLVLLPISAEAKP